MTGRTLGRSGFLMFALSTAAGLLASCANTAVVVPRMKPAEVDLAGYRRIAIGGIGGRGGQELVTDLTQALFETQRFDVLDRQHLDEVYKEHDLSASGVLSDDTAASIGNLIGTAVLLVGDVTAYDYNEDLQSEKKKCMREVKGKDGKTVKRHYSCTHYVREAKAKAAASLKMLDTTTGEVVAVKNLDATVGRKKKAIDSKPPVFDSQSEWLKDCRKKIVSDFMKVIAPYEVRERVELLDDGDLPRLEVGNNFAKLGNWAKAISEYRAALANANSNSDLGNDVKAKAHYNLGVGLGYSGQFDAGVAEIERAFALDPNNRYLHEVQRIKGYKEDAARLNEQRAGAVDDNS